MKIIRTMAKSGVWRLTVIVNQDGAGKKNYNSSSNERVEMLKSALTDLENLVDIVSLPQREKNAKVETLGAAGELVYQVIGADSYAVLPSEALSDKRRRWHRSAWR